MGLKYYVLFIFCAQYGFCFDSKNDEYNEIVGASLQKTIIQQLPKESKFFDELDCKFLNFVLFM